jgi:hypothetical protein
VAASETGSHPKQHRKANKAQARPPALFFVLGITAFMVTKI